VGQARLLRECLTAELAEFSRYYICIPFVYVYYCGCFNYYCGCFNCFDQQFSLIYTFGIYPPVVLALVGQARLLGECLTEEMADFSRCCTMYSYMFKLLVCGSLIRESALWLYFPVRKHHVRFLALVG
jgi:hypothetical protein